jgi:hypothetical protein
MRAAAVLTLTVVTTSTMTQALGLIRGAKNGRAAQVKTQISVSRQQQ